MSSILNKSLAIQTLLLKNTVMSLKQLRDELNGRSRSSLFRDLKKLDVISSCTHTGQYHTLKKTILFDDDGFWFFHDVGFSQYGTLKETLIQLINRAEAGATHREVKRLCRIDIQKPLTHLIKSGLVCRQLLPHQIYLYVSKDKGKGDDQFHRRLNRQTQNRDRILPPEKTQIEILLEVIRHSGGILNEQVLSIGLRERGIVISHSDVAHVLAYYDIKKNGA